MSQDIFSFHISILKVTSIWPNSIKYMVLSFVPIMCCSYGGFTAASGFIYLTWHGIHDYNMIIGCAVALTNWLGYIYARWCIRSCLPDIISLMDVVKVFQKYYPEEEFAKTADRVNKFTKLFFVYGIVGNVTNNILALYDGDTCNEVKDERLKKRDPCGIIARGYSVFDADEFPAFHLYYLIQAVGCFTITVGILMSALVQITMIQYTIDQLRYCRKMIYSLSMDEDSKYLKKRINLLVEYHVNIIRYSKRVDRAFSKMLLLHLTLTSLVISVLGYLIVTSDNLPALLRHCLHLCGWVMLLGLTCYFGQLLIDESLSITDFYNMPWYLADVSVQKDMQMIILKAQSRLKVTCAGVGEMSIPTFLTVMKTAYSYLTLFFKMET